MLRPKAIAGTVLALLLMQVMQACGSASGAEPAKAATTPPPPPNVLYSRVVRRDLPIYNETVSGLDGYVNADIRARVRGYLSKQEYKEGGLVKANQRLFSIERTEYEAAVGSAEAALARAKAAAQRDRASYERAKALFKTGAASQQDIDIAQAAAGDSEAQIEGARAQLAQAQLNLSYTQVRSPIDGVAGLTQVRVGNLVGQDGPTLLTTVSQIDPMRVTFPISERDYLATQARFKALEKRDLSWAKTQFAKLEKGESAENDDPGVELLLSDGTVYSYRGIVVTSGREFDSGTGTIQLQALFPNPNGLLRPGQYGRVRLRSVDAGHNALAVPEKALLMVQGSYSVGLLTPDDKVQLRRVKTGPSVEGLRVIEDGVSEGDRVVVEGVQKISDGAQVKAEEAPSLPLAASAEQGAAKPN